MKMVQKKGLVLLCALLALLLAVLLVAGLSGQKPSAPVASAAAEMVETTQEVPAEEPAPEADNATGDKALAAGIAIGLAAAAGAIGMGVAVTKTSEAIARQPEAEGKIRSTLMLGLVFIETAIIYALIVSILVIFVL